MDMCHEEGFKGKILIADDEPGIIRLIRDFFEIQGYQVIEAANGLEALERLSSKPDLILLDVGMPMLDGFEVCERIRDHVSCPILFLTAKIEEKDRIRGLLSGGDDYILKPFSIDELGPGGNRGQQHCHGAHSQNPKKTCGIHGQGLY